MEAISMEAMAMGNTPPGNAPGKEKRGRKFAWFLAAAIMAVFVFVFAAPGAKAYEIGGFRDAGTYILRNAYSGKYLNVYGGSLSSYDVNGTNIVQWSSDGSKEQKFKLEYYQANDAYRLRALCSANGTGRTMDAARINGSFVSGCNAALWDFGDDETQLFKFVYQGEGKYRIALRVNQSLYLTVCGTANGSNTGKSASSAGNVYFASVNSANPNSQMWYLEEIGAPNVMADGIYNIINTQNNYYLDSNFSGDDGYNNAGTYPLTGCYNQQWKLTNTGNGECTLAPVYNRNLRLDVSSGLDVLKQNVCAYQSNGAANQRWKIIWDRGDTYRIVPVCANGSKVLEAANGSASNTKNIRINTYFNTSAQKWYIVPPLVNGPLNLSSYTYDPGNANGLSSFNSTGYREQIHRIGSPNFYEIYDYTDEIWKDSIKRLQNAPVTYLNGHGDEGCFVLHNGDAKIYSSQLRGAALDHCALLYLKSCNSAVGSDNLAQAAIAGGAKSAIGFLGSFSYTDGDQLLTKFHELFFYKGRTLDDALEAAKRSCDSNDMKRFAKLYVKQEDFKGLNAATLINYAK